MTKDGWKHAVIEAVSAAAFGNTQRLDALSMNLEQQEAAFMALTRHGYKGFNWSDLAKAILEKDRERELDGKSTGTDPADPSAMTKDQAEGVTARAHLRPSDKPIRQRLEEAIANPSPPMLQPPSTRKVRGARSPRTGGV